MKENEHVYEDKIRVTNVGKCRFCGKDIKAKVQMQEGFGTYGACRVVKLLDGAEEIEKWGCLCKKCKKRKDKKDLINEVNKRGTFYQTHIQHRFPLIKYPKIRTVVDGKTYGDYDNRLWSSKNLGKTWSITNPFSIPQHALIRKLHGGKRK